MDSYAPTSHYWTGEQSAYTAGLSYFPDYSIAAEPLGNPLIAAIPSVVGLFGSIGGSTADKQRQARVDYVTQAALGGNVAAAQLILGGPANVSGNERPMWQKAAQTVAQQNPSVMAAAQQLGPYWLVGSNEDIATFPATKAFIQAWGVSHNPIGTAVNAISPTAGAAYTGIMGTPGAASGPAGGVPTWAYLAGGIAVAALLLRRR